VAVGVVERGGGVGAGDLGQHDEAAGVGVEEVAEVVDVGVDYAPEVIGGVVSGERGVEVSVEG